MAFTSVSFIVFALFTVLSVQALPRARSWLMLGANLVFIASIVDRVSQVLPLLFFLLLCFVTIEAARRRRTSLCCALCLSLVISSFVFLKKYSFLGPSLTWPFPYLVVGLSYVLFRVLHLLIDARQGELQGPLSPLQFFNYTCNFLTFVAGPIQRYEAFAAREAVRTELSEEQVFRAFARLIKGYFKVSVVSAIFNNLFATLSPGLLGQTLTHPLRAPAFAATFVLAALCYTVYLYANFAGYMDIVIGIGALLGQDLPENFNQPFLARSFLDFWARWHMTLSAWFRTYLFNPLLKVLASRFTSARAGPYSAVLAFFVTFLVMGVWHGTTSVFVVYGLLLGAGASVNKLWQVVVQKRLGKARYRALGETGPAVYLSRGLTLSYFALALTCLWVDIHQLQFIAARLGVLGVLSCYFGLALASAGSFFVWDSVRARLPALGDGDAKAFHGVLLRNLGLSLQIVLIVTVTSFFHKAPEFVYRAF